VNGRKRHLAVDTGGRILVVEVDAANEPDGYAGIRVATWAKEKAPRIRHTWVDAGYRGAFVETVQDTFGLTVEVVGGEKPPSGFVVQPRRWVVERTFAWLSKCRRLSKDYEEQPETSTAWIWLAMIHILIRRIARH
jgi:putative transposase